MEINKFAGETMWNGKYRM